MKSTTLPAVLPHLGITRTPPVDDVSDPLGDPTEHGLNGTKPLFKSHSLANAGVRDHLKRSLSARGIIRSPTMPAATALQQTHSEAAGKARNKSTASLLSLSGLRGSPAPSPVPSPALTQVATMPSTTEASYISKASLRINEMVNHIFPSVVHTASPATGLIVYKGRSAPRAERAKDLATLIVSEVQACLHDDYLLKTLLRSALAKALSLFLSRIEGLMILPTSEPTLLAVPLHARNAVPTPAQRFAFELVRSAYELRRGLQSSLELENAPHLLEENFRPWIAKLDAVSTRTIGPLIAEMKRELIKRSTHLGSAEHYAPPPPLAGVRSLSLSRQATPSPDQTPLRDLSDAFDAIGKLLHAIHCPDDEEKWAVGMATVTVWKGMLALVSHNMAPLHHLGHTYDPDINGVMTKRPSRLGKNGGKRSPSPPTGHGNSRGHHHLRMPQARYMHDAEALHALVVRFTDHVGRLEPLEHGQKPKDACSGCQFCGGAVLPDDLTSDSDSDAGDSRQLAQEALHEALLALASLAVVLRACACGASGAIAVRAGQSGPCATLRRALDTCPPLILLHLLASQIPPERGLQLPHEIWGVSWADYDNTLRGFASGEEWTAEVAFEMSREAKRMHATDDASGRPLSGAEDDWTAALEEQAAIHSQDSA